MTKAEKLKQLREVIARAKTRAAELERSYQELLGDKADDVRFKELLLDFFGRETLLKLDSQIIQIEPFKKATGFTVRFPGVYSYLEVRKWNKTIMLSSSELVTDQSNSAILKQLVILFQTFELNKYNILNTDIRTYDWMIWEMSL